MTDTSKCLRVAALIDLPRTAQSGGHVKCWERIAAAAAKSDLPLDLTVYFSGAFATEVLAPHARIRHIPPVFSTARLKFLPYMPDSTDLSPYHPALAREIGSCDVIHTTDGFFAFARTAEKLHRKKGTALVTSFHTDTPSYTRIFTRRTIESLFGAQSWLSDKLLNVLHLPERKERRMIGRLSTHVRACNHALVTREEDRAFAQNLLGEDRVHFLRLGVDRTKFGPHRRDRSGIEATYNVPENRLIVLFVGRLDVGKNIYTLIAAMEKLLAEGFPLHLITAGVGPAEKDLKTRLSDHVTVAGFIQPDELARLYASVDVLALCSEVEIRSMAGVEGITSGCPVLVAEKSGIAKLFNNTPAMRIVHGGVEEWTTALRDFARSEDLRASMREVALAYGKEFLASWQDVLAQDLFAVWKRAAEERLSKNKKG